MTIAIISLFIIVPVAAALIWRRWHQALFGSLLFGVGTYAVIGLLRIPLEPVLTLRPVAELLNSYPALFLAVPVPWILTSIMHALLREGTRWLILSFVALRIRTWKEGVMFGLGYSWPAALQNLLKYVAHYSEEIESNQYSLFEAVEFVNNALQPPLALLVVLDRGIAELFFNVGTCLVVMLGVRRRNPWFFLTAVLWYVLYSEFPRVVLFNIPLVEIGYFNWVLVTFSPTLARLLVALLPLLLFCRASVRQTMIPKPDSRGGSRP